MSEIKFRAWGPNCKHMWQWDGLKDLIQEFGDNGEKIIMQYTGLKDKNGVEIFEGDILQENGDSCFSVVWDEKWAKFKIQHPPKRIQYPEWNRGIDMEVIGNIHENPELLKP